MKQKCKNICHFIGVGSKFKVRGLDFKIWILTIVCVKIYVKCMHPLLKSGGAEAPPAPPSAMPLLLVKQNVMKFEVFILGGQRIDQKRKKGWWRGSRERIEMEAERG